MATYPSQHAYRADPATDFGPITPSDTVNLAHPTRAIYVGSIAGGAVVIATTYAGTAVTFAGCIAGSVLPIRAYRINSTGTTATSLVALY